MKIRTLLVTTMMSLLASAGSIDAYDFTMNLKIPRVYDNTQSLGYRAVQRQRIHGHLLVKWEDGYRKPTLQIVDLVNATHRMSNGKNVAYDVNVASSKMNAIGSNKTQKFNIVTMVMDIEAEPSYNIGEMNEDNGLYVKLSGFGKMSTKFKKDALKVYKVSGKVAGNIGCGCFAYGHTSPTRAIGELGPILDLVDDIAAVEGTWKISYNQKLTAQINQ